VALAVAVVPAMAAAAGSDIPRRADGKPNFDGVWQAINAANWALEPHNAAQGTVPLTGAIGAVSPGRGVVEGGSIPYLPSALKQRNENYAHRLTEDPEAKCFLPGVPRATYIPHPFQFIQSDKEIMILYEYAGAVRTVYMADQIEAPVDSWMGWSNGHWDGDTLVVDVTGLNGQSWLDRAGDYASDSLHVVERYTMIDRDHIQYEATLTDPTVFSRPWKISMPLYRRIEPDAQLMEFKCVEFAEDVMYGKLYKTPPKLVPDEAKQ
jgi:hypothetical protein